jgi:hypothetical protein
MTTQEIIESLRELAAMPDYAPVREMRAAADRLEELQRDATPEAAAFAAIEILLAETERQLDKEKLERAIYKSAFEELAYYLEKAACFIDEDFRRGVLSVAKKLETKITEAKI